MAASKTDTRVSAELLVRRCSRPEEFAACVDLQKEVWQFADIDIVPIRYQPRAQVVVDAPSPSPPARLLNKLVELLSLTALR